MAVADVYDALISRQVYKPDMPHQQAVTIIMQGEGSHFDPDIADAFLSIANEFQAITTLVCRRSPSVAGRTAAAGNRHC